MKNKPLVCNVLLVALIVLENLFLYYFYRQGVLPPGKNANGLFCTSVLFGIVLLYKFYNTSVTVEVAPVSKVGKGINVFTGVLMVAGMVGFAIRYSAYFPSLPIDFHQSDVIPLIQVACRRFLSGKFAYDVVTEFGWDENLTYMPLQWMPFCIAELMKIDYRWIAFAVWCIAALVLWWRSLKLSDNRMKVLIAVLLLLSHYALQLGDIGMAGYTVELLIAGYYMMFAASLNSNRFLVQAITISLCLLSRFSIVLWLPLYAFTLFVSGARKQLFMVIGGVGVLVLLIYVLPFMTHDPTIFYRGYKYYDKSALHEWTYLNYEQIPGTLFSGTGFAYYIYSRFAHLDIEHRIKLMQRIHLVCSLGITVLMGLWYWFNRNKIDRRIFLSASFKIYLAVFLFLIQVPYVYLMCVGNFVSVAMFCEQARYRVGKRG
jgi:hypothetical protein